MEKKEYEMKTLIRSKHRIHKIGSKKKQIIYPQEVINEAWELFKIKMTFKEIAKALKIRRLETIYDWAKKFNWNERRQNIVKESSKKADEMAIDELAKSKAEYLKENLIVTDKIKYLSNEYLNECMAEIELAKRENMLNSTTDKLKALLSNPKFQEKFKLGAKEAREIVKCQDNMLFSSNHQNDNDGLDYGKAIAAVFGVSEDIEGSDEEFELY
jgi:hypothetical protein